MLDIPCLLYGMSYYHSYSTGRISCQAGFLNSSQFSKTPPISCHSILTLTLKHANSLVFINHGEPIVRLNARSLEPISGGVHPIRNTSKFFSMHCIPSRLSRQAVFAGAENVGNGSEGNTS